MSNAIVVLNAGSSSVKFSLYLDRDGRLEPDVQGHIEGIFTAARFMAKAPDGTLKSEKSWPAGVQLGHDGALDHLIDYLRAELIDHRLIGIGHRVVHGGRIYTRPVRVDAQALKRLEAFAPLAPLHQPHNLRQMCGAAPGQRRQHVRPYGRVQHRRHDGFHGRGGAADGHAQRLPRPRRGPLSDGASTQGGAT